MHVSLETLYPNRNTLVKKKTGTGRGRR